MQQFADFIHTATGQRNLRLMAAYISKMQRSKTSK